jgi:uncharacterized protein (DUF952 family)
MAGMIYKILSVADWEAAQAAGRFAGSADDRRDGFIHFSDSSQVIGTAAKYFSGQAELVLLTVDPGRLPAPVRGAAAGRGLPGGSATRRP